MTDLGAYLAGSWRVERALEDAALGAGRFRGSATFTADGDGLAWVETGRITLGSYDGPARRTLRLVRDDRGWAVRFADNRPFHRLDLDGTRCVFEIGWDVSGPAKAQRLTGRYVRQYGRCGAT